VEFAPSNRTTKALAVALLYSLPSVNSRRRGDCVSVGQLAEKGSVGPANRVNALSAASKWYASGCTLPNSDEVRMACFLAGNATFESAATKKGKAHVRVLASALGCFLRACELDDDDSCKVVIQVQEAMSKP
jgi:hypothetical protein